MSSSWRVTLASAYSFFFQHEDVSMSDLQASLPGPGSPGQPMRSVRAPFSVRDVPLGHGVVTSQTSSLLMVGHQESLFSTTAWQ